MDEIHWRFSGDRPGLSGISVKEDLGECEDLLFLGHTLTCIIYKKGGLREISTGHLIEVLLLAYTDDIVMVASSWSQEENSFLGGSLPFRMTLFTEPGCRYMVRESINVNELMTDQRGAAREQRFITFSSIKY